jgi:hypothetical protein
VLEATRHALIRGRSGTGKSVLLHFLARELAAQFLRGSARLPLFLDLRTHPLAGGSLEGLIHEALRSGKVELPPAVIDFLIGKGGFLLLVDSLNEIPEQQVRDAFHPFLNRDANNEILIASQIDVLERPDLPVYLLAEVTSEQARAFLREAVGNDVWDELPESARVLARNPQDLALLAVIIHNLGPSKVPTRRAALYREMLNQDNAMVDWARADAVEIRSIYALAFRMIGEQRVLGEEQLGEWVRGACENEAGGSANSEMVSTVIDALKRSRLFVEEAERDVLGRMKPVIGFRHELIGKFLASRHVRGRLNQGSKEDRNQMLALSTDEAWLDAFCFVIDEIDSQRDLANLLDDLIAEGHPVGLRVAAYALGTKPTTMVPSACRDRYAEARLRLDLELTPAA